MYGVPTVRLLIKPTFDALKRLGGTGDSESIQKEVIEIMGLDYDAINAPHKDHSCTELEYNLKWARTNLKNAKIIENLEKGIWRILPEYRNHFMTANEANDIAKYRENKNNYVKTNKSSIINQEYIENNYNNLTQQIRQFNEERDWDKFHSPENLAKSISIEAGELLECFQWNNDYNKEEVCEELADVFTYCIMMADKLGVNPEEIILNKLEKTKKKYPVEKAKGVSTKYDKL